MFKQIHRKTVLLFLKVVKQTHVLLLSQEAAKKTPTRNLRVIQLCTGVSLSYCVTQSM